MHADDRVLQWRESQRNTSHYQWRKINNMNYKIGSRREMPIPTSGEK